MKTIFTWLKWLLIVIVGLPLSVYLLLILINVNDEEKSNTVIEFEKFLAQRTTVDDKKNGFVYAMGLTANIDDDFYLAGVEQIKRANMIKSVEDYSPTQEDQYTSNIEKKYTELTKACGKPVNLTDTCAESLQENSQGIDGFLADNAVLLQRYQIMINQPAWYESLQANPYTLPSLSLWHISHKVFLLYVWQQASMGKFELAANLLQQDSVFWRKVLSSTHYLLHFVLVTEFIQQHYDWGVFSLNSSARTNDHTVENVMKNVPSDWSQSYSAPVFSFDKIAMGEWQFGRSILQQVYSDDDWSLLLIKPIFNLQSTLNFNADLLVNVVKSEQSNEQRVATIKECNQALSFSLLKWYSYNPVGKLMTCVGGPSFHYYYRKIIALEDTRLAALKKLQAN